MEIECKTSSCFFATLFAMSSNASISLVEDAKKNVFTRKDEFSFDHDDR